MTRASCETLDASTPSDVVTARAASTFNAGGMVVFPTETVYGIAASVLSEQGMKRLRQFKGRQDGQPFSVHMPGPEAAARYVDLDHPLVGRLVRKSMPGPVTLVVQMSDDQVRQKVQAMGLTDAQARELYHEGAIGLRCPDHDIGRRVLGAVEAPVVASSANAKGLNPPTDASDAAFAVQGQADLIVDGGACRISRSSTVVKLDALDKGPGRITMLREGMIDERMIRNMARWTLLVVCTGNTCRSPMAKLLAQQWLAEHYGLAIDDLSAAGLEVVSAGCFATGGQGATEQAVEAMQRMGLDLSGHRSQRLTLDMVRQADLILGMTPSHVEAVLELDPQAAEKTMTLDPQQNGVSDPVGGDLSVYQRCAEMIRRLLDHRLKEQRL